MGYPLRDFRFKNADFRFKSLVPRRKECMQPQSAIYNLKSQIIYRLVIRSRFPMLNKTSVRQGSGRNGSRSKDGCTLKRATRSQSTIRKLISDNPRRSFSAWIIPLFFNLRNMQVLSQWHRKSYIRLSPQFHLTKNTRNVVHICKARNV